VSNAVADSGDQAAVEDAHMPVTQRWVHGGLILTVAVLSLCLAMLVAGAARNPRNDIGLAGSKAAVFYLRDTQGQAAQLDAKRPVTLLIFADQESKGYTDRLAALNKMLSTYTEDPEVSLLGISYVENPSLLGPSGIVLSALETACPKLRVARDDDGSVARAYRVHGAPTLVVIDAGGIIRGRVQLDNESAFIAATETISSLTSTHVPVHSMMGNEGH
jgi:hypothetical protein